MVEENFRRALLLSRGNMAIFVERPISGVFVGISALLLAGVTWGAWRKARARRLLGAMQARMDALPASEPA